MAWTWTTQNSDGAPAATEATMVAECANAHFESQGDAESYLGEIWRDLFAAGVTAVTLHNDEAVVYTMSLEPPQL